MENKEQTLIRRSASSKNNGELKRNKVSTTGRRYKSLLTCVVCSGDAHGYNFDAISCESCKAFFRRNALRPVGKLKCRGVGNCRVDFNVPKRCKKCRLEKCFRSGMRKEWILSESEKEEKRRKIQENRRLKQLNQDKPQTKCLKKQESSIEDDLSLDFLSFLTQTFLTDYEWFQVQSIQNSYSNAVQLNQMSGIFNYPSIQTLESTSDLFRIPLHISSMRLITYFKQINEFQQLETKDQIFLIKTNLIVISFFHSLFIYDANTDSYHEHESPDPIYLGTDWRKTIDPSFHFQIQQIRNEFIEMFQFNETIVHIIFLLLLFSNRVSLNQSVECSFSQTNSILILQCENVFAELLFKYLSHIYDSTRAVLLFTKLVQKFIKLQRLIDEVKFNIYHYLDVSQLSPLMESLLL